MTSQINDFDRRERRIGRNSRLAHAFGGLFLVSAPPWLIYCLLICPGYESSLVSGGLCDNAYLLPFMAEGLLLGFIAWVLLDTRSHGVDQNEPVIPLRQRPRQWREQLAEGYRRLPEQHKRHVATHTIEAYVTAGAGLSIMMIAEGAQGIYPLLLMIVVTAVAIFHIRSIWFSGGGPHQGSSTKAVIQDEDEGGTQQQYNRY